MLIALFTVMLFAYQTGLAFHETMGLSMLLFMVLHVALNWSWVIRVSKKLYGKAKAWLIKVADTTPSEADRGVKPKTIWMYALDTGILLGFIIIICTGVLISQVLFPVDLFNEFLFQFHRWTAYCTVGLMCVHLLVHWNYLIGMLKAILTRLRNPMVRQALSASVVVLVFMALILTGTISNIQYSYDNRLLALLEAELAAEDLGDEEISLEEYSRRAWEYYETVFLPMAEEKRQSNSTFIDTIQSTDTEISLSGFLGSLFCTMCARFCPLNALACGHGRNEAQEAEAAYQQIMESRAENHEL